MVPVIDGHCQGNTNYYNTYLIHQSIKYEVPRADQQKYMTVSVRILSTVLRLLPL